MSKIEWTNQTWNPVTGCDRVSPGCDNCYALTMSARLKAMGQPKYQTDGRPETSGPGFGVQTHPDTLDEPLRWRKPRRVFVNSMSDLFHPQVPDAFIRDVWEVMGAVPQHTFQVLTKRPKRMRKLLTEWTEARYGRFGQDGVTAPVDAMEDSSAWPLPNVWLGVSVEDWERADQRIPLLLDTPAAVRFVSAEPLLGPVDLRMVPIPETGPRTLAVNRLDWVIIGGESGPGARLMHPAWAHGLVRQCQQAGTAVFVKQLGSHFGRDHHNIDAFPPDLQVRQYPDEREVPA